MYTDTPMKIDSDTYGRIVLCIHSISKGSSFTHDDIRSILKRYYENTDWLKGLGKTIYDRMIDSIERSVGRTTSSDKLSLQGK